ncbi:hypothetical protein K490DRAFT_44464 [Saccharata proteae CBS 121410]|uniref:ABM domain-containing protein n=1 Tax=Saccharata proteae CBS 121410 TaxID=1314787 RepID=A0A9P4HT37_9PEZI|nr:hypothetical protein K490DRAFT_44464 [Saccharata proteae CBS 121410]
MSPVTEIATLTLKPGTDVKSGEGAKVIESALGTIARQPGYQRCYLGTQVEKPNVLNMFIDWDSLDSHKDFMSHPTDYKPMVTALQPLLFQPPSFQHVPFAGSLAPVLSAPVTEILIFYFPTHDLSEHDRAAFEDTFSDYAITLSKNAEGNHGVRGGWTVDEVQHKSCVREGVKEEEGPARCFVGVSGWESREAHAQYRETKAGKDMMRDLRDEARAVDVCHVELKQHQ